MKLKSLQTFPLYCLLLAIYPVLSVFSANQGQVSFEAVIRPLLISLIFCMVLMAILRLITKNWSQTGILTGVILLFFFTYGHIYTLVEDDSIIGWVFGRHRYLLVLWVIFLAAVIWFLLKRSWHYTSAARYLNIAALILVLIPSSLIISRTVSDNYSQPNPSLVAVQSSSDKDEVHPDIYYIILDAYGRHDALLEKVDYDNSAFIQFLKDENFYVASCSLSNHNHTQLSIATSLNMNYLSELPVSNFVRMGRVIKENAVRQYLRSFGYKMVAFETGYSFTEVEDADIYYKPNQNNQSASSLLGGLTSFEILFARTTILAAPMDLAVQKTQNIQGNNKRQINLMIYDRLKRLPDLAGPKFVLAHITTTHPPFVFDANGNAVNLSYDTERATYNKRIYKAAYHDSLIYSDKQIRQVVETILANSKTPPIIILQGDHGPQQAGAPHQILNAYYFPDHDYRQLYQSITPVNSFRVVLDHFFNADYPLLPDISYDSKFGDDQNFTPVEYPCNN